MKPSPPRRVILTGATGFIGRHCVRALLARGYDVHAVSSKEPASIDADITWHRLNLHDPDATARFFDQVRASHLMHLAWSFLPGGADSAQAGSCPSHYQWTQTTLRVVRQFKEAGGLRVVGGGSSQEYDWSAGLCSEFTTLRVPANYYGVCKNALFDVLSGYADQVGLSLAWARVFFLYGPYEPLSRLVPTVIHSLLRGEPALCSHGLQVRDYLYVQDVADALVAILDSEVQGPVNVASQEPIALRDLVGRAADKLGRRDLLRLGSIPARSTDAPTVVGDVARLRDLVGWRPAVSLDEGLDRTIDFWRSRLATPPTP